MFLKDRKKWLYQEEARLIKYQHQHRGLSFQKLLLPTVPHRKVKLVGRDNHIYNGSIPKVPEDQLPPEVDEKSIDDEALYKEIRDMNFPPVPEQEPLGPSRRIEGEYTLAKRMALAPVHVDCTEGLEETLVLGKDGGIYRGKEKYPSKLELDKKLGGTKRPILKVLKTSSTRGYVEPSLVRLQAVDNSILYGKSKKSLIELPTSEIENVISMVKEKNIKWKGETVSDTTDETEATELEREDFQSEDNEVFEKSDETDTDESPEADESSGETEITREGTEKASEEGGEEDSTEEGTEEATKEGGEEDIGKTSEESDAEAQESDESPESEKSLDTETASESDTKESEELDIGESPEADELPGAGGIE